MKVGVLIKQVPSSEARIKIAPDGRSIDPADVDLIVNPYDEYAMEAALQLKEKLSCEVVVLSVGGARVEEALKTCLALGADRAVALRDPAFVGGDALTVAKLLAMAVRKLELDFVLTGKVSIDEENSAVGVQAAECLDWPHVSAVSKLEWTDATHLVAHREIEGGAEVVEVELPALLTCNKGLNEPRYASLKGIMAAKKKPLEVWDAASVGIANSELAALTGRVIVTRMEPPPPRAAGQVFSGDAREAVTKVVAALKRERKLI